MNALNGPGASTPKVLIVDDEAGICLLLRESLRLAGFQCQTASSGPQALEILLQEEFDALISDLWMPGMSGLELLATARTKYPKMILILASGGGDIQEAMEAEKPCAHEYLLKPFRLDAVVTTLKRALENKLAS